MPLVNTMRRLANSRHIAMVRKDREIEELKIQLAAGRAVRDAMRRKLEKTLPLLDEYFAYDTQSDIIAVYEIIKSILVEDT